MSIFAVGSNFKANTGDWASEPSIALSDTGEFVVTWDRTSARRYTKRGVPAGDVFPVLPNKLPSDFETGDEYAPEVAIDPDGDFTIAWEVGEYLSSGFQPPYTFIQQYKTNGKFDGKVGLDYGANPDIAMNTSGEFVISSQAESLRGSDDPIYVQRYTSTGKRRGKSLRVNIDDPQELGQAPVALSDQGQFVVTWQSVNPDATNDDILARRYTKKGKPRRVFQVNTFTSEDQRNPDVAMNANGDFVVTWESRTQDGSGWGIFAQRYNEKGEPVGSEFQVNSSTADDQTSPAIAMDDVGNFVIAWKSNLPGMKGIFGQYFNHRGVPQGEEFQVNTRRKGLPFEPAISINSSGDAVITWRNTKSYDDTILVQRYEFAANGDDTIIGSPQPDRLQGRDGNDVILGLDQRDHLIGGNGNDTLKGNAGEDNLVGNAGKDWLNGGKRTDRLTGGPNNDIFVLQPSYGVDKIQDFELGVDKIGLGGGITIDSVQLTQRKNATLVSTQGIHIGKLMGVDAEDLDNRAFTEV